jgi:amidophosphoribosyltransferase
MIKEIGGAKEVHVRVACPPIIAPCFYGIDMSTVTQLFAPKYMHGDEPTVAEQARMAEILGATSLFYLPLAAIAEAIGLPEEQLCRACVTGRYPTTHGERMYQLSLKEAAKRGGNGKAYGQQIQ